MNETAKFPASADHSDHLGHGVRGAERRHGLCRADDLRLRAKRHRNDRAAACDRGAEPGRAAARG